MLWPFRSKPTNFLSYVGQEGLKSTLPRPNRDLAPPERSMAGFGWYMRCGADIEITVNGLSRTDQRIVQCAHRVYSTCT